MVVINDIKGEDKTKKWPIYVSGGYSEHTRFDEYNHNKILYTKISFDIAGNMDGECIEKVNGIIREKGQFSNNKRSGLWYTYYSNGFLASTKPYDPNSAYNAVTGFCMFYSEKFSGLLVASGNEIESLAQGQWTFWVYYDDVPKLNYYYYRNYVNGEPGEIIYPPEAAKTPDTN